LPIPSSAVVAMSWTTVFAIIAALWPVLSSLSADNFAFFALLKK